MARDFQTRLNRRAIRAGLTLSAEQLEQLETYFNLLSRWNEKINLTSLSDPDAAMERLLIEPLLASRFLPATAPALLDVGSGGGSPAIPLKLAAPQMRLLMVEVKTRKSAFLREAVRQLALSNAAVETARVEELLTTVALHEAFDVVSVRAVRVEAKTLNTLQAFLVAGGQMWLFRSASGPDAPPVLVPPLEWVATHPLGDLQQSRLTVLSKRGIGGVRPQ